MASAAEQLAGQSEFRRLAKADALKKRIWFHARRAAGLPPRHLYPAAGHQSEALANAFSNQAGPAFSACSTCSSGGAVESHGDLRARHHALYLDVDHHRS